MNGAFHFVKHVIVSSTEDDGCAGMGLCSLDKDTFIVTDALLDDFLCISEVRGFKGLVAVEVREGAEEGCASGLCYTLHVFFGDATYGHAAPVDKFLETHVVDALCGHDDVCSGREDLFDALNGNVGLTG